MKRRQLLGLAAALAGGAFGRTAGAKQLASDELALSELDLTGDKAFGRALLLVPRALPKNPELLVLLHGLGETHDQVVGSRAFAERYGLLSAVERLSRPPLARTLERQDYFGPGRLDELNARLARRAFRPPVLVCPYTPNPYKAGGDALIRRYTSFLTERLKIEVEQRTGAAFPPSRCMVSGVSLGGYLALEVFLRTPEAFCAVGTVQGAIGQGQAARYAAGVEAASQRHGARRVEILTSSSDPYRRPNEALHQQLQKRNLASRLRVSPGPHDQRWLRESGTVEMLVGADEVFAATRGQAT